MQETIIKAIGIDKVLHFAFGGWVACLASIWYTALLTGFIVGLIKELSDKYITKSVFDYGDSSIGKDFHSLNT